MELGSLTTLKSMLANKEGGQIEFKKTTGQLERGMETLCAFLNGTGGTLMFGITDKGEIIGQEVSDKTKREIAEAISRIEPLTAVQISYIQLPESEKKVISLHVEDKGLNRPFCYKGRPYMRVESVTTTMPQSKYIELLMHREEKTHGWETSFNVALKISDLDEEEILKTVRLGIDCGRLPETTGNDIPIILEKLDVFENGVLKIAAAVLFAKRKLAHYPQNLLRLARFKGTNKNVFIDSQRIHGNIFQLLDAAMAFIFKHLSLSGKTDSLEREEHLEIPYPAIREAVVNALCHRDYRDRGGSVAIAIYDDRVEIENPGSFPPEWNIERIKSEHGSKPHNPIIADTLYFRKVLENWGRGINLIIEECRKANLPLPEYRIFSDEVKIIFQRKIAEAFEDTLLSTPQVPSEYPSSTPQVLSEYPASTPQVPSEHPSSTPQVPSEYPSSTPQVPSEYPASTTKLKSLIEGIGENTYSVSEMMKKLRLKDRRNFMKVYLKVAVADGFVELLYPETPKHPKQKYRLTEKGRDYWNLICQFEKNRL